MFHAMEMCAKEDTTEMKEASFVNWTDLIQDRDRLLWIGQHTLEFHKLREISSLATCTKDVYY